MKRTLLVVMPLLLWHIASIHAQTYSPFSSGFSTEKASNSANSSQVFGNSLTPFTQQEGAISDNAFFILKNDLVQELDLTPNGGGGNNNGSPEGVPPTGVISLSGNIPVLLYTFLFFVYRFFKWRKRVRQSQT